MPVMPNPDQSSIDVQLTVTAQQARSDYPYRVRWIAKSWAEGLKALLGLSGLTALAAAPIAANTLGETTSVVVGCALGGVFLTATFGLFLVMAASSGTTTHYRVPVTYGDLAALQRNIATRAIRYLRLGRGMAAVALLLFAAAVVLAWVDPWKEDPVTVVITTTNGEKYCGNIIPGNDGAIIVATTPSSRETIPFSQVRQLAVTSKDC
jgi:hypothetical protein